MPQSQMPHPAATQSMTQSERRSVASLASLYALRMLGLFMVMPVMMIEGHTLTGATPELLGLTIGIYGLTQALLQIPAGTLSDRLGRKPIIIGGLLIFTLGSVIAACADDIYWMMVGRALQGAGAIASAIMAMVTDLTREEHRMKAMASIGASIGLAFSVALVLGPWLAGLGGLSLIFSVTAILAVLGILVTLFVIPTPAMTPHRDATAVWSEVWVQAKNPSLWPLNLGVFILHLLMVAIFVAIPQQLSAFNLDTIQHGWLYLPVLLVAFVFMVPFIIIAEKKQRMKSVVLTGALAIVLAMLIMSSASSLWHWVLALLVYFWGFNLMEASLPSWLSKVAPAAAKGSAMGIFSTLQFLGAFFGGLFGGKILAQYGSAPLFVVLAGLMVIWVLYIFWTPAPKHLTSVRLNTDQALSPEQLALLQVLAGVSEVTALVDEGAVYLKVNAALFDPQQASSIVHSTGGNHGSQR